MERSQTIDALQNIGVPESLQMWLSSDFKGRSLSWDDVTKQVYDIYSLPQETWELFQGLNGQISPSLDHYIREVRTFKELNSPESVQNYLHAALVDGEDKYWLLSKIDMGGEDVHLLYNRLIEISSLEDLSDEQKQPILDMMANWEVAALNIICDPELYFIKNAYGNAGTISEFFGLSISYDLNLAASSNIKDGRYRERILSAIDVEGIVSNKYSRSDFEPYHRQENLLQLLFRLQGDENRLGEDFWREIQKNEDFIFISHSVAVQENFGNVNELLVKALGYAWRKSEEGGLVYGFAATQSLRDQFEGKTAADKFLANPEMRFEEVFGGSRRNVVDFYLQDYQQIDENEPDFLVLLDCSSEDDVMNVTYVQVGSEYVEETVTVNSNSEVEGLDGKTAETLLKIVQDFENFKTTYLEKLALS